MKTILLLRHAKSDRGDPSLADFDRPLAPRGRADAPYMGAVLARSDHRPDLMLASPARRAKQTAELVAEACGYADAIRWEHVFYSGDADDLLAVLQDLPREIERPLLVGHNPTLEETVALLLGEPWLGVRLPTAGLVRLDVKLDDWRDLEAGDGVLRWLVIPKLLRQLERGRISEGGDG